jgi:Arc/MetJ family transcription regulator
MRTTVTLDEKLVSELVKVTNVKTKTSAVTLAVKEHIRRAKLKKLAGLLGTIDVDEETMKESNQADIDRAKWLEEIGNDK